MAFFMQRGIASGVDFVMFRHVFKRVSKEFWKKIYMNYIFVILISLFMFTIGILQCKITFQVYNCNLTIYSFHCE